MFIAAQVQPKRYGLLKRYWHKTALLAFSPKEVLGQKHCAQLVREMKGSLTLENHPEGGARSRLRLPAADDD